MGCLQQAFVAATAVLNVPAERAAAQVDVQLIMAEAQRRKDLDVVASCSEFLR